MDCTPVLVSLPLGFLRVLWVELCLRPADPPEKIQILTLVPQNVTLFGNSIIADETS